MTRMDANARMINSRTFASFADFVFSFFLSNFSFFPFNLSDDVLCVRLPGAQR